jgi:hypothetical protein
MSSPRFTIFLTNYHWSCGAGCCSDSGYKINVEDNEPPEGKYSYVMNVDEWEFNPQPSYLIEEACRRIAELLGREPIKGTDYNICEDDAWSDQEELDNS